MTQLAMTDFFISYNGADERWAEWVAWQLENAGYTVILQAWDFRPGGHIAAEMQRAVTESERTIAILSNNYLRSEYTQAEWGAAFVKDPAGAQGTLLLVRVEDIHAPGLLAQIAFIDLVNKTEEDAKRTLLAGVRRGRAKPAAPPTYPGKERRPKPSFPGLARSLGKGGTSESSPRGSRRWFQWLRNWSRPEVNLQEERGRLLKQVRRICIDETLNKMKAEVGTSLKIRLHVRRGRGGTAKASPKPALPDPDAADIVKAFDNSDNLLLILGEPGSGKTFKLHELLEVLLKRAERSGDARIPVVLNLSSWVEWADSKNPIRDWLTYELTSVYGVERKLAEYWLKEDNFILLLDRLDEITAVSVEHDPAGEESARKLSEEYRRKCLHQINSYIHSKDIWLALCCEKKAYAALGAKLYTRRANSTAMLLRLTHAEVENYFNQSGTALKSLREAMTVDRLLRSMARRPFLLYAMSVAYEEREGLSAKVIVEGGKGSKGARRKDLFEKYVHRRSTNNSLPERYGSASIQDYLGLLADKMQRGNSKLFHVDQLQPNDMWLLPSDRWLYRLLVSLLLFLFMWVLVGLPVGWALGYERAAHPWASSNGVSGLPAEPIGDTIRSFHLEGMWLVTLCCGGIVAAGFALFKRLGFGVMCGIAFGLTRALTVKFGPDRAYLDWLAQGAPSVVLGIAVGVLMMCVRGHDRDRISPLKRSKLYLRPALIGVATAACVGVILAVILSFIRDWREGLPRGLAFGFALIPVCVLLYGYRNVKVEIKTRPNQGIRNSALTALWTMLWSALTGAACFSIFYGLFYNRQRAVLNSILGLSLSVISLVFGWMPVMQHWGLRIALYLRGCVPLRLVRFLNAAESLHLLRGVGGGYTFQHEFLRKYFHEYHEAKAKRRSGW